MDEQEQQTMDQQAQDLGLEIADAALVSDVFPPVPLTVSRRRGLQALYLMRGLTEDAVVDAIKSCITDGAQQYMALVEFRTSQTFQRNRPLVTQMGQLLQLDLDALFIMAASLP